MAASAAQTDNIIDAAWCFYGIPQSDVTKIAIPVIGHFGELDEIKGFSDAESARKLQTSWTENGVNGTIYIYPNCGHAFTNEARVEAYNEEAAKQSFDRMYEFFRQYLL